jgi:YgiT-type zinc finger domain-containing protein
MSDFLNKPCSECGGELRRRSIQKEFERRGMRVKLDGIRAWICESCGEVYFEPGGPDRLPMRRTACSILPWWKGSTKVR